MKIYSPLIVLTIFIAAIYAKGRIALTIQRIKCEVHDPETYKLELCSVKAVNRTTTLINFAGTFLRSLNSFMINSQLYKKSEIKYRPFLVNVTDNYCDFMSPKKKAGVYMKIVAPMYMAYTNMNHSCPYFGYHFIKDLPVDEDKIPPVWPSGNYLLESLLYEIKDNNINKVLTSHLNFEIKQRTRF